MARLGEAPQRGRARDCESPQRGAPRATHLVPKASTMATCARARRRGSGGRTRRASISTGAASWRGAEVAGAVAVARARARERSRPALSGPERAREGADGSLEGRRSSRTRRWTHSRDPRRRGRGRGRGARVWPGPHPPSQTAPFCQLLSAAVCARAGAGGRELAATRARSPARRARTPSVGHTGHLSPATGRWTRNMPIGGRTVGSGELVLSEQGVTDKRAPHVRGSAARISSSLPLSPCNKISYA